MGAHAHARATCAAGDGAWAGRSSGRHAVEHPRPSRTRGVALLPHAPDRRDALQALYQQLDAHVERLDAHVRTIAQQRSGATVLMTHPGRGPVNPVDTDGFPGAT